ncbi:MAG: histidinol-phosphate transaminase [Methylococcales symbiont of Iophon sp. n. MRB-2018]|nr:MAG: histidinol-phosphate transaminase [Methylococcales symbiont of Iophon sp. n. MRB-2018]KAF3980162.1 MAG: histidinol-phosphate transaminase [Methylococcales symbiont of Iophon sp. n. MRB-2018]
MTSHLITTVFRKEILALSAYKVAEAKNLIKLDAMENPYTWPENIKTEWLDLLKECPINRYPDAEAQQLVETIRHSNQIPAESGILLGNGSDEIIQLLLMALPEHSSVLAPSPSFVMYKQVALSLGLNYQGIPLLADSFELDLLAMLKAIEQTQPLLIFLSYPNNPTANLFSDSSINSIINAAPALVIIDEAYAPFANASYMEKLENNANLLVMRTVSKLGLAGLRLGFIAGNQEIIEQLNKIRLPYNINSLTQVTVDFALKHQSFFNQQTQQICQDRTWVFDQLKQLPDITAYQSSANFILFKTAKNRATAIFEALKEHGILIKNLSPQGQVLTDCLRVTIGKPKENKAFIKALTLILHT